MDTWGEVVKWFEEESGLTPRQAVEAADLYIREIRAEKTKERLAKLFLVPTQMSLFGES